MRILVVEDSDQLRSLIVRALRKTGYVVEESADGRDGCWKALEMEFDVILLDLMLPGMDGIEILGKIRAADIRTPVLLLTARNEVEDRVLGLRSGADDYLGKPFDLDELLARVDALIRRGHGHHRPVVRTGSLSIDTAGRSASYAGQRLDLTAREYRLLEFLAIKSGQVLSRPTLEEHLYDENGAPMSNAVDATIYQLRRKLRDAGCIVPIIHTRRGEGYVLEEREKQ
jgi:DNA-binding response OmpR family regulator